MAPTIPVITSANVHPVKRAAWVLELLVSAKKVLVTPKLPFNRPPTNLDATAHQ